MFILRPEEVDDFLATLPVGKIPGVGKRMQPYPVDVKEAGKKTETKPVHNILRTC